MMSTKVMLQRECRNNMSQIDATRNAKSVLGFLDSNLFRHELYTAYGNGDIWNEEDFRVCILQNLKSHFGSSVKLLCEVPIKTDEKNIRKGRADIFGEHLSTKEQILLELKYFKLGIKKIDELSEDIKRVEQFHEKGIKQSAVLLFIEINKQDDLDSILETCKNFRVIIYSKIVPKNPSKSSIRNLSKNTLEWICENDLSQ